MSDVTVIKNFINGEFVESKKYIDSFNPASGRLLARVPDSDETVVENAVNAAKNAFTEWSNKDPSERSKLLHRVADILESRLKEFAIAESQDQGKPLWLAQQIEVPRAVLNFRHFANTVLCDKEICINQPEDGILNYTSRSPCGVTAVIVPWNLPLYLLSFKLGPALAYGNTVVAKPSEFTSITAWKLCSVLKEAGIPDGVVNMVFGYGHKAGDALIRHPDVSLITFTGSDRAGLHIAEVAGAMAKKVSLEMGGKNAAIVFHDADFENCIPSLIRGSFINQGQVCLSTSRIYVEKKIFSTFAEKFVSEAKKIKMGDPLAEGTWLGPVCSKPHYEKIKEYLKIAKEEGATFLCGSENLNLPNDSQKGYFIGPVVLTNLPDDSRCMQEEIFGPVTCLTPFEDVKDVIERANKVNYGLSATIWSTDLQKIHSIAPKLEVGTVWCNCWLVRNLHMPFGGEKRSGLGREGTEDSREFYTHKKTICIKYKLKNDSFF
ncbi:2-aminomuconic semialdehyde dehydrogenase [Trichonephila inaurata madagascariensis]|uniref:2-aminomuconic semialdehyde dehydrogenase n=1 Tax=Trichonephila inaurata madagascariensis TaxID=2747483 RepID=A0A8X7CJW6_9ARAC|nr:2-aminomuconic semialdehyde dehydrogenase [Trichonephila inaurata madagascariensis]